MSTLGNLQNTLMYILYNIIQYQFNLYYYYLAFIGLGQVNIVGLCYVSLCYVKHYIILFTLNVFSRKG